MPTTLAVSIIAADGSAIPAFRHRVHILADILGDDRMFGSGATHNLVGIDMLDGIGCLDLEASNPNHDAKGRFASYGEASAAADEASDKAHQDSEDARSTDRRSFVESAISHASEARELGDHLAAAATLKSAGGHLKAQIEEHTIARESHREAAAVYREAARLAPDESSGSSHRDSAAEHMDLAREHHAEIADLRETMATLKEGLGQSKDEATAGRDSRAAAKASTEAFASTKTANGSGSIELHFAAAAAHDRAMMLNEKAASSLTKVSPSHGKHERGMAEAHDRLAGEHRAHAEAAIKGTVKAVAKIDLLAYSPDQARDEKGRFAGSDHAAAKEAIGRVLAGQKTAVAQAELMGHLGKLTTKELNGLRKEHGLKASGTTKAALVAKLHNRLSKGRWTGSVDPTVGNLPNGKTVAFVPHANQRDDETMVMVDPKKLDDAWSRNLVGNRIPVGGGGPEIGGRRKAFSKFLETGKAVQASRVSLDHLNNAVIFDDGRHRFSVLRDAGIDRVAVTVPGTQELDFRSKFGSGNAPVAGAPAAGHSEGKPDAHWGNKAVQPYYRPGPNPTVDNVITRDNPTSGQREILLIRRADKEGVTERGKWALPGGFHDTTAAKGEPWKPGLETAKEAAVRELKEETGLDASTLTQHLREVGSYEGGGRDPRDNAEAWSKSTAFHLHLRPELASKVVRGEDDADKAEWKPLHEAKGLAFDHDKIVQDGTRAPFDSMNLSRQAKADAFNSLLPSNRQEASRYEPVARRLEKTAVPAELKKSIYDLSQSGLGHSDFREVYEHVKAALPQTTKEHVLAAIWQLHRSAQIKLTPITVSGSSWAERKGSDPELLIPHHGEIYGAVVRQREPHQPVHAAGAIDLAAAFNPNQPRDEKGQFASGDSVE